MWAFCFIYCHGEKLSCIYSFPGSSKVVHSIFFLSQPDKYKMGVIPLRAVGMVSTACYLFTHVVQIPLSASCIRICTLTRPPWWLMCLLQWEKCWLKGQKSPVWAPCVKLKYKQQETGQVACNSGHVESDAGNMRSHLGSLQLGVWELKMPVRNTACMGVPVSPISSTNPA